MKHFNYIKKWSRNKFNAEVGGSGRFLLKIKKKEISQTHHVRINSTHISPFALADLARKRKVHGTLPTSLQLVAGVLSE